MNVQETWCPRRGWYWLAQGDGPLRYIICEGETRALARMYWTENFSRQYAEAEAMSAPVYHADYDDIRTTNYER